MKTTEELQNMNHEDLIREFQKLQNEVQNEKTNVDYWYKEHQKVKSRFDAFKNMVKSIVILLD